MRTELIAFRISREQKEKLEKLAAKRNTTISDVIRALIKDAKIADEDDSDVKRTSTDRARLIAELQRLHAAAEKKRKEVGR